MISSYKLDYKIGTKVRDPEDEITAPLTVPKSISIDKKLSSIGTMTLRFSGRLDSAALSQEGKALFPQEIRLLLKVKESVNSDAAKEVQIFRGFLDRIQVEGLSTGDLILSYVDPLISCCEIDSPQPFRDLTIDRIFERLLENAFTKQANGNRIALEFQTPPIQIQEATNSGMSDFDFIRSLSNEYGYSFYYDSANQSAEKVKFFRPDFSKKGNVQIDLRDVGDRYEYSSRMHSYLDEVVVHGQAGEAKALLPEIEGTFSDVYKAKREARKVSGVELVSHFYRPELPVQQAKALAEARLMEAALGGDSIRFVSDKMLQVGDYVDFVDTTEKTNRPPRIGGTYLISEASFQMAKNHWSQVYRGVRP